MVKGSRRPAWYWGSGCNRWRACAGKNTSLKAALLDQPFAIEASNPGRNAAVIGINVAAWQTENVALFAKYAGEFRGNANSQQGSVGLRVTW